jgi:ABC-2 type transport system permease protein
MLKALFEKQMLELNQNFFRDRKTGKAKSKAGVRMSILFYVFVIVVLLGGFFSAIAVQLSPLIQMGYGWLYLIYISFVSLTFGIFGSVFNTFASLYQAKDNDLLLSLPIPVKYILAVRLMGVYLMGAMYSMVVYVPALIIYYVMGKGSILSIPGTILFALLLTVVVLLLSCILGWLVAKINARLRHKSLITVVVSLAFFAVYYMFCMQANQVISKLIQNADATSGQIQRKAYCIYLIGRAAAGAGVPLLGVSVIVAVLFAGTILLLSRSFLTLAMAGRSGKKAVYKEKTVRKLSPDQALLAKEAGHLLSSPTYLLNCALGTVFLVVAGVALLIKMTWLKENLVTIMDGDALVVIAAGVICAMVSMNDITAPSISLEGKNLWLMQSLPVTPWQVLRGKLNLHLLLTEIPVLFCGICVWIVLRPHPLAGIAMVLLPMAYGALCATFGLSMNLCKPNLNWTSETVVVKQSGVIFAVIFGGWALLALIGVLYFLSYEMIPAAGFLFICVAVFAILSILLLRWLKGNGAKKLTEL